MNPRQQLIALRQIIAGQLTELFEDVTVPENGEYDGVLYAYEPREGITFSVEVKVHR